MQKPSSKFSAPSKNKRPKKTGRMLGDGEFERLKRTSMTYQKVSVSGEFKKCSEEWVRQLTSAGKTNGVVNLFPFFSVNPLSINGITVAWAVYLCLSKGDSNKSRKSEAMREPNTAFIYGLYARKTVDIVSDGRTKTVTQGGRVVYRGANYTAVNKKVKMAKGEAMAYVPPALNWNMLRKLYLRWMFRRSGYLVLKIIPFDKDARYAVVERGTHRASIRNYN